MTKRKGSAVTSLAFALAVVGCQDAGDTPWRPTVITPIPTPTPVIVVGPEANWPGYTLSASSTAIVPGSELTVSWTVPSGEPLDWIALFDVGARCIPGSDNQPGWWEYTKGETSGTRTLRAPTVAGRYQFHYYSDDSCMIAARSIVVTVAAGG